MIAALLQRSGSGGFVALGSRADDGHAAADQLLVGGLNVYHQVAVHLAQADHRAGGEHVQHHFLGCAALHAGGAGHDLGAGHRCDAHLGQSVDLAAGAAGHTDGHAAQGLGVLHSADDIGRAAAGGDAHQHILFGVVDLFQILAAQIGIILGPFDGTEDGRGAACDEALHQLRLSGVGGRALDSIEDTQPAGGAGAHVDEPSALLHMAGDDVHGPGDVLGLAADSVGHLVILLIDQPYHLQRGHAVDMGRSFVALLGRDSFEFNHNGPP